MVNDAICGRSFWGPGKTNKRPKSLVHPSRQPEVVGTLTKITPEPSPTASNKHAPLNLRESRAWI